MSFSSPTREDPITTEPITDPVFIVYTPGPDATGRANPQYGYLRSYQRDTLEQWIGTDAPHDETGQGRFRLPEDMDTLCSRVHLIDESKHVRLCITALTAADLNQKIRAIIRLRRALNTSGHVFRPEAAVFFNSDEAGQVLLRIACKRILTNAEGALEATLEDKLEAVFYLGSARVDEMLVAPPTLANIRTLASIRICKDALLSRNVDQKAEAIIHLRARGRVENYRPGYGIFFNPGEAGQTLLRRVCERILTHAEATLEDKRDALDYLPEEVLNQALEASPGLRRELGLPIEYSKWVKGTITAVTTAVLAALIKAVSDYLKSQELKTACENGDLKKVTELLAAGVSPVISSTDGSVLDTLLKKFALELESKTTSTATEAIIFEILPHYPFAKIPQSSISLAASYNNLKLLNMLLAKAVDSTTGTRAELLKEPLFYAISRNHPAAVRRLLPFYPKEVVDTIFTEVLEKNPQPVPTKPAVLDLLLGHCGRLSYLNELLWKHLSLSNYEQVKVLKARGARLEIEQIADLIRNRAFLWLKAYYETEVPVIPKEVLAYMKDKGQDPFTSESLMLTEVKFLRELGFPLLEGSFGIRLEALKRYPVEAVKAFFLEGKKISEDEKPFFKKVVETLINPGPTRYPGQALHHLRSLAPEWLDEILPKPKTPLELVALSDKEPAPDSPRFAAELMSSVCYETEGRVGPGWDKLCFRFGPAVIPALPVHAGETRSLSEFRTAGAGATGEAGDAAAVSFTSPTDFDLHGTLFLLRFLLGLRGLRDRKQVVDLANTTAIEHFLYMTRDATFDEAKEAASFSVMGMSSYIAAYNYFSGPWNAVAGMHAVQAFMDQHAKLHEAFLAAQAAEKAREVAAKEARASHDSALAFGRQKQDTAKASVPKGHGHGR